MTLSFSTKWPKHMGEWAGQPNYFVWKILQGIADNDLLNEEEISAYFETIVAIEPMWPNNNPKLHTIRQDPHGRWKKGMKIHPVINNRTPQRFQFAPEMVCTGIQYIHILNGGDGRQVSIGDRPDYEDCMPIYFEDDNDTVHGQNEMEVLALNDGFESVDQFFAFFKEDFRGKIIHWTDLRY